MKHIGTTILMILSFTSFFSFDAEAGWFNDLCESRLAPIPKPSIMVRSAVIRAVVEARQLPRQEQPAALIKITEIGLSPKELAYVHTALKMTNRRRLVFLIGKVNLVDAKDTLVSRYFASSRLLSAKDAVRAVAFTGTWLASDELLKKYAEARGNILKPDDLIHIVEAISQSEISDKLIHDYVTNHKVRLDSKTMKKLMAAVQDSRIADEIVVENGRHIRREYPIDEQLADAIELAQAATDGDRILLDYFGRIGLALSRAQTIQLAEATSDYRTQDFILEKYANSEATTNLSPKDIIALAEATSDYAVQDGILMKYAKGNFHRLSVAEVITLGETASDYNVQDDILLSFAKSQITRLRVRDLRKLAEAGNSIEDDITELIDHTF